MSETECHTFEEQNSKGWEAEMEAEAEAEAVAQTSGTSLVCRFSAGVWEY